LKLREPYTSLKEISVHFGVFYTVINLKIYPEQFRINIHEAANPGLLTFFKLLPFGRWPF
jgi:hypothetical protein